MKIKDAAGVVHTIAFPDELLRASGIADIDLFGFVGGRIGFSFEAKTVDVQVDAATGDWSAAPTSRSSP